MTGNRRPPNGWASSSACAPRCRSTCRTATGATPSPTPRPHCLTRALREEPLAHTASAVREALDRVTPQRIREEAAFLEAQRRAGRVNRVLSRMALDSFVDTVSLNNVS